MYKFIKVISLLILFISCSCNKNNSENCFKNSDDILNYLEGKKFTSDDAFITFNLDKAMFSDRLEMNIISSEVIEGKGYIRLNCISIDCPSIEYHFWVSCNENTLTTPGNLVYTLNK